METPKRPTIPTPANLKAHLDHLEEVKAVGTMHEKKPRPQPQDRKPAKPSKGATLEKFRENRKRAFELKKKGYSKDSIADIMELSVEAVEKLLKPREPQPHLTQRIEGLEGLRQQLNKKQAPKQNARRRNGGKKRGV